MNVGDRVRLLTGREQGIVTRLLSDELVEVAIDNDFTIPVLRREVVVVAADEDKAFGRQGPPPVSPHRAKAGKHKPAKPAAQPAQAAGAGPAAEQPAPPKATVPQPAAKGLYLALSHQSPELLSVHVINHTDRDVLYTYGEENQGRYRGLRSDKLGPKAVSGALAHLHLKDFDQWPAVVVQLLPHQVNGDTAYELLTKRTQFKAASFYSSRREAPVLGREAYLFQLDEKPAAPVAIAPEKLAEALQAQLTGNAPAKPAAIAPAPEPAKAIKAPPHELDLHLEALRPEGGEELSNTAILKLQLEAFEDALSRALATNMHEIVFIHGSGSGTLRKEIHKLLSRNKDIKFFEDSQKEKFGYGATLVRLK
ncbi:Smr/MutS family protein [Hymenobacter psychrotolerans]|uniref:Smr domain-containing protein n=1 Tax=Hymenobacter psychrotolerans DSM 18569 TaxID=1121959 RepID=A0A1M6VCS1_9BACT|nr:Smr/MutS family protein [Hymenobacter psychrotolerans]SHK79292.1 Smr domain-containing protein [Hymenobacter psychrotolerans DSM 18569]